MKTHNEYLGVFTNIKACVIFTNIYAYLGLTSQILHTPSISTFITQTQTFATQDLLWLLFSQIKVCIVMKLRNWSFST